MRTRLLLVLLALISPAGTSAPSGQSPATQATLATVSETGVTTWRFDGATGVLVPAWRSAPVKDREEAVPAGAGPSATFPYAGNPLITDLTGDGVDDLVISDRYGVAVYGAQPAYYAWSEVRTLTRFPFAVTDVDGDGRAELVVKESTAGVRKGIEVWRPEGGRLTRMDATVTGGDPLRSAYVLMFADADNDGRDELILASDAIFIYKQATPLHWELAAELPFPGTLVDVVCVGDVDGDGKNEILATGNSGMVTIYRQRPRNGGRDAYPVIWQSPFLGDDGGTSYAFTQGLAVADVNGDGRPEILVGTVEGGGARPDGSLLPTRGRVYIFASDARRGAVEKWHSDWTGGADIPAFSTGDLDGDGVPEFVYNGVEVFGFNKARSTYERRGTLGAPPRDLSRSSAIGVLRALHEPVEATRIIPLRSTLPTESLRPGQTAAVSIAWRATWAGAKDVTMSVTSESPNLVVTGGIARLGDISPNGVVNSPAVTLTAASPAEPRAFVSLTVTITAAGGYRQVMRLLVSVAKP